jgi:pyruvate dehydrogenase E2 component (dihydrolipoamide acetyltransferase)
LELETDKATIEVPSSVAGVIKELLVKAGDAIKVGQVVAKIEAGASASASAPAAQTPAPTAKAAPTVTEAPAHTPSPSASHSVPRMSAPVIMPTPANQKEVAAAPTVRRLARELGLNITDVPGTGPGGRISKEDVKAYAKQLVTVAQMGATGGGSGAAVATRALPDFSKWGEVERKPMNNIRRVTADHLGYAWSTIPHVTQFDKADITNLEKLRAQFSKPERKLSITPFLMKVVAAALKMFPQFNASIDMTSGELVYKKFYNIGVAVDTPNGLLVPVIRDIEKKGILEISEELNAIAVRAREKKLSIDDMRGGTFTISNLGGIGGTAFTPIVNWPEVAILGVARGSMEPKYDKSGVFVPALMLPLALSYDHRIIDGADGARFLRWVANAIEQPFLMELDGK